MNNFRRIVRNPSGTEFEAVADIFVAKDYDPHSPASVSSEFAQTLRSAMDSSDSFREWVRNLVLASGGEDSLRELIQDAGEASGEGDS